MPENVLFDEISKKKEKYITKIKKVRVPDWNIQNLVFMSARNFLGIKVTFCLGFCELTALYHLHSTVTVTRLAASLLPCFNFRLFGEWMEYTFFPPLRVITGKIDKFHLCLCLQFDLLLLFACFWAATEATRPQIKLRALCRRWWLISTPPPPRSPRPKAATYVFILSSAEVVWGREKDRAG